jgi:hypothetical protein
MLNPSTADAEKDDPTIRKVVGFSKRWGAGGLVVVNLFAYRSTDPKKLLKHYDPVGPGNDAAIERWSKGRRVIAAWGANARVIGERDQWVQDMALFDVPLVECLKLSSDGYPWHPLYVPYDTEPIPYMG